MATTRTETMTSSQGLCLLQGRRVMTMRHPYRHLLQGRRVMTMRHPYCHLLQGWVQVMMRHLQVMLQGRVRVTMRHLRVMPVGSGSETSVGVDMATSPSGDCCASTCGTQKRRRP